MRKAITVIIIALVAVSGAFASPGLMVGTGIKSITPTSDLYPMIWGAGARGFVFIGALDDIYIRALAISNAGEEASVDNTVLFLSLETGKRPYPPALIKTVSEKTGIPEDRIFWSATHVHSAPNVGGFFNDNWRDSYDIEIRHDNPDDELVDISNRNKARYGLLIEKQLVEAAREALGNMQPAEVALGTTTSNINVNRDTPYASKLAQDPYDPYGPKIPTTAEGYNGQGFSDKTLTVIEFRNRETKDPVAFITHYAMHNTLLYANDYFNADYLDAHGVRIADPEDIEYGYYDLDDPDNTVLSTKLEYNVAYVPPYEKSYRSMEELTNAVNVDHAVFANAAIHPDIGGLVSQYIERKYPGSVALWVSGAAGDQNPVLRNTVNFESPYTGEVLEIPINGGMIDAATYYASIQFVDVQRAIAQIEADDDFESDTPVRMLWGETSVSPIDALYYSSPDAEGVPYPDIKVFLTVLTLGDITFAGSPAELYNAIGVAIRDESVLGDNPSENTLVINHAWTHSAEDNWVTYYPDDVAVGNNSYQWTNKVKYPEGVINEAHIGLLEELWAKAPEV